MLILLGCVALMGLGIFVAHRWGWDECGTRLFLGGAALLLLGVAFMGANRLEDARAAGLTWEAAGVTRDVATWNGRVAAWQYWNGTLLDIWIPDYVMDLKPIRAGGK